MAIKTIPCGGFFYDDESVSFEKDEYGRDVMRAAGGGGESAYAAVIYYNNDTAKYESETTYQEVIDMFNANKPVVTLLVENGTTYSQQQSSASGGSIILKYASNITLYWTESGIEND